MKLNSKIQNILSAKCNGPYPQISKILAVKSNINDRTEKKKFN